MERVQSVQFVSVIWVVHLVTTMGEAVITLIFYGMYIRFLYGHIL